MSDFICHKCGKKNYGGTHCSRCGASKPTSVNSPTSAYYDNYSSNFGFPTVYTNDTSSVSDCGGTSDCGSSGGCE